MNGEGNMRMNESYRTWKFEARTYYIVSSFYPLLIGDPANHIRRSIDVWERKYANQCCK